MRRRLFLEWFGKTLGAVAVAPKTFFDLGSVQPVNALDTTVITSRDMRIPLQLRPGALYGGGASGGKTYVAMMNPNQLMAYELDLVKGALPGLFAREDLFYKSLEEAAKKDPNYKPHPVQKSLFDGVNSTPIIEPDDEGGWGDDEDW